MAKLVHPTFKKYKDRIRALRNELKYWKRKFRDLEKKHTIKMQYAKEKLLKSRFPHFDDEI